MSGRRLPQPKLTDDIDPAPRILRIVAAAICSHENRSPVGADLKWAARALEGDEIDEVRRNSTLGRVVSQTRRRGRWIQNKLTLQETFIPAKKAVARLNDADERSRKALEEAGLWEDEEVAE